MDVRTGEVLAIARNLPHAARPLKDTVGSIYLHHRGRVGATGITASCAERSDLQTDSWQKIYWSRTLKFPPAWPLKGHEGNNGSLGV